MRVLGKNKMKSALGDEKKQKMGPEDQDATMSAGLTHVIMEIDAGDFPDDPPAVNFLPATFMKNFLFVPLADAGEYISVAMADPFDFNTREVIARAYNKPIKVFRAPAELIAQHIYRWYEAEADMSPEEDLEETDMTLEDRLWDDPEQLKDMASEAPVIRLVNHLISKAYRMGASDIHIEPRRQYVRVRFRIDGVLHDQEAIANRLKAAIISRVKLMAKMDIAEMRLPQDGKIRFRLGKEEIDIRVSSIPTGLGECLVLRLLHQEDVYLDPGRLGFSEKILEKFQSLISMPYGMLLVSGPTGSGKTTTLYAALNTINSPDRKIVTVEDPVEYQLEGITQVQVLPKIGLTFANCLRSFLRHDPDIILVGEIRDVETAEIAVQAALTGHMVFSTLHTNDAAGAITRLEDMGI
ncbi:MAG: type II/IV secretion system protein, partial [Deltaproteobacteria bacterium]|nr:type II/IV secretion system protein [Deltaproteobacteria bacterium]